MDELVKRLREEAGEWCANCCYKCGNNVCGAPDDRKKDCDVYTKLHAADAIEELSRKYIEERNAAVELTGELASKPRWIPVTERLPECDIGAEKGNIEWISNEMVHAGCFGRGGKYRDAYFRTWTDAGEGMDAKDADYWRAVTLPEPPKEET